MATLADQQKLEAEKAQYQAEYKATIAERRRVIRELNNPRLSPSERSALDAQYQQLDAKATRLDEAGISTQTQLNRVTNQINQGANPPVAGPGGQVPSYANQNTGGNPNQSTATRYQQAVADDQVRLNQANQGLANTNEQIAAAERERAALSAQLRSAAPGSPEQAAILARRNELNQRQAELETQQSALQDDIRVRENSLATNQNNLSLVQEGAPERVSAPPPTPTTVVNDTADVGEVPGTNTVQNFAADEVTDTGGVPTQTLADFEPVRNRFAEDVTDTGGVPTQSLADIDGDTGFVPRAEPVDPETNLGYGDEDAVRDPDTFEAEPVTDTAGYPDVGEVPGVTTGEFGGDPGLLPDQVVAQAEAGTKARLAQAQQQATIQQRFNQTTQGDWRVRLRLAPSATYLYKDPSNSLLRPLMVSDGVIFPYVPTIQTNYTADYEKYNLTHSNYRGYFYKSSYPSDISITAKFTAQDTKEAEYLLAVIHFFRSVTKMFYGKDALRGAPPPFLELSGLGQYQFNNHPCLVSLFNYSLPNNVDYIRVNPNNQGLNLTPRRNLMSSTPPTTLSAVWDRLSNARLPRGATPDRVDLGIVRGTVSGTSATTYVPTMIEIQLTLLPLQTRSQVSQLFSLKNFANGNLLRGGHW